MGLLPALGWAVGPSVVEEEGSGLVWRLFGEELWRFQPSLGDKAMAAAEELNVALARGFSLSDLKVVESQGGWSLMVGSCGVITFLSEDSGLLRLPPRVTALLVLSRIYDVLGASCGAVAEGDSRFRLRGGSVATGKISWYGGESFVGRRFSNGEVYTGNELVAAAKDLPFGTLLRIKNPATGKTIVVRVVDRFREHKGRILDVSKAAAEMLGFKAQGIANVLVEVIGHVKKVGGK